MKSEGLEHLSYEKRETSHISSGRYSIALFIIQNDTGTVLEHSICSKVKLWGKRIFCLEICRKMRNFAAKIRKRHKKK